LNRPRGDDGDGAGDGEAVIGMADATAVAVRRPWMAPPVDRIIERPELGDPLLAALTAAEPAEVGLTTALQGAGGFGKTTLAGWVSHHRETKRRYPGGLLWVTVGQEVSGADLAERVNDLSFVLSGQRPAISDPNTAGTELGRLLDEREPVLLVIDDVWDVSQLRPFRFGGRSCTRLITTRIADVLPMGSVRILVDAMSDDQARQLVSDGLSGLDDPLAGQLATVSGRWPVLLNLVNGALQQRVRSGQPPQQAADEVIQRLLVDGPGAFDPARPADRNLAVAATVDASLTLLDHDEQDCCLDLAVFPEDVDVPLEVLRLLWPQRRVEELCDELLRLGLVADYRRDAPSSRLVIHDVIRAHLLARRPAHDRARVHGRLVDAARTLLPAGEPGVTARWWLLPVGSGYLLRFLPYHLCEAGKSEETAALVCDLRWAEAKIRGLGTVVSVEADLQLVNTPIADTLRRALGRAAHLLSPITPPTALGAILASRLDDVGDLRSILDRYRATLSRPRLEPAWRLPDLPSPALLRGMVGHTGKVLDVAFSSDGRLLASAGYEGTIRVWDLVAGIELAVLAGSGAGRVTCVAFSPDSRHLASAHSEGTVGLWDVATGTETAVLTGHTGEWWSVGVAFSPDGRLLAYAGRDATVQLWDVAATAEHAVLTGHAHSVGAVAFSPDGRLLATGGQDCAVRLWDMTTATEDAVLTGHAHGVGAVAFSPDGRLLASADYNGTVRLWDIPAADEHAVLTSQGGELWALGVAFSPDGRLLAAADRDGMVRLWDTAAATEHAVLTGHADGVGGVAFSPDGRLLASAGHDRTVRLWDTAAATTRAAQARHIGRAQGVAFSPDGQLLASAGHDRTIRLWDTATATELVILTGHSDWVNGVVFSPDGQLLASAGYEGTVRLWDVTTAPSAMP
jgi:WD40 repeat protein